MTDKNINMMDNNDNEPDIDIDSLLADNKIDNLDSGNVDQIIEKLLAEPEQDPKNEQTDDKKSGEKEKDAVSDSKNNDKDEYDKLEKEELIEHLRKKDKRIRDKDAFIGKRSSEIGDLRKQLSELEIQRNSIVDPSEDEAIENPVKSMKKIQENVNKRALLESKIGDLKTKETVEKNMKILETTLGKDYDFQNNMAAAIEVLKQDKAPKEFIDGFINNPGLFDSAVTFNIFKRAEAELKIAALEKKIDELSKSKTSITDKFNKAGKTSIADIPTSTGKDGGNIDIDALTPEQVDAMLKKLS